jgi:hypothetical protein
MNTVAITRKRISQSASLAHAGPEWKWNYYLPQREVVMPDGHTVVTEPGGFSTKAEIVDLARQVYDVRPLSLQFPDGTVKEIKR